MEKIKNFIIKVKIKNKVFSYTFKGNYKKIKNK